MKPLSSSGYFCSAMVGCKGTFSGRKNPVDECEAGGEYCRMKPEDKPDRERSKSPGHQFPPGLEFLASIRRAAEMEDREARKALVWTIIENVRDFSDRLRQHGLDPDRIIIPLQKQMQECERADKEVQEQQDKVLHAAADIADASREVVDALELAIRQAAEEKPFDPEVQEWQEELQELRK